MNECQKYVDERKLLLGHRVVYCMKKISKTEKKRILRTVLYVIKTVVQKQGNR
jgi:hypothetical protein